MRIVLSPRSSAALVLTGLLVAGCLGPKPTYQSVYQDCMESEKDRIGADAYRTLPKHLQRQVEIHCEVLAEYTMVPGHPGSSTQVFILLK